MPTAKLALRPPAKNGLASKQIGEFTIRGLNRKNPTKGAPSVAVPVPCTKSVVVSLLGAFAFLVFWSLLSGPTVASHQITAAATPYATPESSHSYFSSGSVFYFFWFVWGTM